MTMEFTGERYVPHLRGQIYYEHFHRYAIAARFAAGKRVLDIASGEGYGSALLARTAESVIGIDIDEQAVEYAKRRYYASNLRFLCGSVTGVPLGDASIDVIASFETIEHVAEHEEMLDEFCRVLVPGGILMISSPNKLVYSDAADHKNPFHVKELYFAELRDLLSRRFGHVAIYGQRVAASSLVHPLAGRVSGGADWYNGAADPIAPGLPTLNSPAYFMAVCSDEPLTFDISSAYLDPDNDLLFEMFKELDGLRAVLAPRLTSSQAVVALPGRTGSDETLRAGSQSVQPSSEAGTKLSRAHTGTEEARSAAEAEAETETPRLSQQLEAERADARLRIAECVQSINALQRELDGSRTQLRRAQEASLAAVTELSEERARVSAVLEELTELRLLNAAAGRKTEEVLEADRRANARTEAALREQIAALTEALEHTGRDSVVLREVLASHSWRLTSPLRHAVKLIRR